MSRLRSRMILLAVFLLVVALSAALSLSPAAMSRAYAQTVPTITPTPDEDPTSPPGLPPAPTEQATTPPTLTRPPAVQATATRRTTATGSATPTAILSSAEADYPTAEACSPEPTVLVLEGGAWVYEGPGDDYDALGRLDEETVRPIVARAAYGAWWLIALEDDETGWIADDDVAVQGDTSALPVEDAPALPDGHTPTPGPTWEPTPDAGCATPTATPTATEEPTSTPDPTETATATATVTPVLAVTDEAEPLPIEEDEGSSLMWLPVAGIVLLAAGALLYVTRRSQEA